MFQLCLASRGYLLIRTSQAVAVKCDVTSWDDQVAMFDVAVKAFGGVNVVVSDIGLCPTRQIHLLFSRWRMLVLARWEISTT